ncbi:unnamed protein product [Orchesella dallaii]|uniref:Uncharacterized protein n=1 Tax=Orchesella dallaii TaxID=48710 RepID=A0ABP1RTU0_9HEXA
MTTDVKNYYPDLRCHPGFNESVQGQTFLEQSLKHCSSDEAKTLESPFRCVKSCILMMLGVLVEGDNSKLFFAAESDIASVFKETLFENRNNNAAEFIAEDLVSNCAGIMISISDKNTTCEAGQDWTRLFACVEESWECQA